MKRRAAISLLFLLPLAFILIPAGWLPRIRLPEGVVAWLAPAMVGVLFTTLGLLKVYGWKKGIVGGAGKAASCRLLGRCPSWSKQVNIGFMVLFLGVGVVNLGICLVTLLER